MIEIRCFHELSEAQPYRDAINALNLASARPDPFSTFEFYQNYLLNAGRFPTEENLRLWLLLAFDGAVLVGTLVLKHTTQRVFGLDAAKLDFLTTCKADRPHLVSRPEHAAALSAAFYAYLLGRKKEWSLLEFAQQEPGSPLLPAAAPADCHFEQWPNMANGTIPLHWDSVAGYFAALSHKSRSNVSRQMRSLLAAGDVQLLTSSDPKTVAALFQLYRNIESYSWKAHADDAAISHDDPTIEYYTGLMQRSQPMRIVIQVLLLDGVPVAGLICGAFEKGLYALQIVYDGRLSRLAPGSAILLMGVRMAIETGYDFFDLLGGYGYYKSRWLAQMSDTHSIQIYRNRTLFYWRRMLGNLKRRLRPAVATDEESGFNPARRGADTAALLTPDPRERERYAALIAQVRSGRGEFLSAQQLAAVLPFSTRRPAAAKAATRLQPAKAVVDMPLRNSGTKSVSLDFPQSSF